MLINKLPTAAMLPERKQLCTSHTNWWLGWHLVMKSSSAFAHLTLHSSVYVQTVLCCCFLFRAKGALGSWGKRQKEYCENCTIYTVVCPFIWDPCENSVCWWSWKEENKSWFPFLQAPKEAGACFVTCSLQNNPLQLQKVLATKTVQLGVLWQ